jgi:hypothetical protein
LYLRENKDVKERKFLELLELLESHCLESTYGQIGSKFPPYPRAIGAVCTLYSSDRGPGSSMLD